MQESRGVQPEYNERQNALHAKHTALSNRIKEKQKSPSASGLELQELKAQRLQLKDLIHQENNTTRHVS